MDQPDGRPQEHGTIVYVHGASDRQKGVTEHVGHIRKSLDDRGATAVEIIAANWGEEAGPDLEQVCRSLPDTQDHSGPCVRQPEPGRRKRLMQLAAAGVIASQFLSRKPFDWAKLWATDTLLERRQALMQEDILGVADALVFQRAGEPIRKVVRTALEEARGKDGPLIAMGNSLGGIILFDVLREPDGPKPDLFVTVGSQSSALQTLGALGDDDRKLFQPWLNIYDRRDFFAFVAEPVWEELPDGEVDYRVDMEKGFPEVHGPAYFRHQPVFDAIFDHPAVAAILAEHQAGQA